jgi:hypothetical protein
VSKNRATASRDADYPDPYQPGDPSTDPGPAFGPPWHATVAFVGVLLAVVILRACGVPLVP